MKLKVSLSAEVGTVEDSIDWLATYLERSWDIPDKFLTAQYVMKVMRPLYKVVPYSPTGSTLYRIMSSETVDRQVGDVVTLGKNKVISCTSGKGRGHWDSLADQIGALEEEYCYVVAITGAYTELCSMQWALTKILQWAKKNLPSKDYQKLEEQKGYVWQKEVLIYSNSSISANVVSKLN